MRLVLVCILVACVGCQSEAEIRNTMIDSIDVAVKQVLQVYPDAEVGLVVADKHTDVDFMYRKTDLFMQQAR